MVITKRDDVTKQGYSEDNSVLGDQKLTPTLRKALKDITRKIRTLKIECLCLFIRHTV